VAEGIWTASLTTAALHGCPAKGVGAIRVGSGTPLMLLLLAAACHLSVR
jgi:hypothetical protein